MSTLVVLGTTAAWLYSTVVTFAPSLVASAGMAPMTYFDSAAVIIGLVLFGRWLEARAKAADRRRGAAPGRTPAAQRARRARRARAATSPWPTSSPATLSASAPARRCPSTAASSRAAPRSTSRCSPARPCPWPRAPATRSSAARSTPPARSCSAPRASGRDTVLAQIVRLVEQAQGSKAPIQRLADRVTAGSCRLVLAIAAFTFVVWMLFGPEPRLTYALVSHDQRADHRLSVRDGPGHADGHHGRHRPRRRGGHPDPRRRGPRAGREESTRSCSTRPAR